MKKKKAMEKTLKWAIPAYIGGLLAMLIIRYFFNGLQSTSVPVLIIMFTIVFAILTIPIYFKNIKEQ